jgi:hypothetical protein
MPMLDSSSRLAETRPTVALSAGGVCENGAGEVGAGEVGVGEDGSGEVGAHTPLGPVEPEPVQAENLV